MTTRYVVEREQFGVKIATFQAVQQMIAVMAIELEGARHVTHQALWRLSGNLAAAREVAIGTAGRPLRRDLQDRLRSPALMPPGTRTALR